MTSLSPDAELWIDRARRTPLALLLDLDGTLIPFAGTTEEAMFDRRTEELLAALAAADIRVVIVSGRPLALTERVRASAPTAWWIAEHGAWRRTEWKWEGPSAPAPELGPLVARLSAFDIPGLRIEPKSRGVAVHWRQVPSQHRAAAVSAVGAVCREWLERHADYQQLDGVEVLELRHRSVTKANAVRWVRERMPDAYLVAIGDDVTDEDMFGELRDDELPIAVGARHDRATHARAWVSGPDAVRELLWWMLEVRGRREGGRPPPGLVAVPVRRRSPSGGGAELVVLSNRTPNAAAEGRARQVGGLVSALEPALRSCGGVWVGWSGSVGDDPVTLKLHANSRPARATFDLTPVLRDQFYSGFCSQALWPLLHAFPSRARFSDEQWHAYREANAVYARFAASLARPTATIWAHDYHLLLVAARLREIGHRGPIGLFLHVPFPPRDILETLPWCDDILDAMRAFDLLGFHTDQWADNFRICARARDQRGGDRSRWPLISVLPIGVDPEQFVAGDDDPDGEIRQLQTGLGDRKLMLGVDRLDYSKGIPERLAAFERLLERYPQWRGRVTLVQVSVPSRVEVPDHVELRHCVENMVGHINGTYGDAGWVPVRYLYRSYPHRVLAQLYRAARVGLVTPLRDGLNLVAKEYVAAQDFADPGVLVLSRFAGAAVELTDALLTNPYHADGLASDLDRALRMELPERQQRQRALAANLAVLAPRRWAASFLEHLGSAGASRLART